MAEELVMNVKSNIKGVTEDTKNYGQTIERAEDALKGLNVVLAEQKESLSKLKDLQRQMPKYEDIVTKEGVQQFEQVNNALIMQQQAVAETTRQINIEKESIKELTKIEKENTKAIDDSIQSTEKAIAKESEATTVLENKQKTVESVNTLVKKQADQVSDLEKELVRLQKREQELGKGTFEHHMSGVGKQIEKVKLAVKGAKLELKDLTREEKAAAEAAKKFAAEQKAANKEIKDGIGNFSFMGVSLNGIKKSFGQITASGKVMFRSIKMGLLSTGIGAFILALGSVITYVTSTKEGMDKLNVTLAKIGAAFNVVKDRIAGMGKIITGIFNKPLSETLSDIKDNFEGITDEMIKETEAAGKLEKASQKLRDVEKDQLTIKAEMKRQIAEARLIATDETKSLQERKKALTDAVEVEKNLLQIEIDNQAERVRIAQERKNMSNSTAEDERKLQEEKAKMIELETKSFTKQKMLARQLNGIQRKISAEQKAREQARLDGIEAEKAALQELMDLEADRLNKQITDVAEALDEFYASQRTAKENEILDAQEKWESLIAGEEEGSVMLVDLKAAYAEELDAIDKKYATDDKKKVKDATRTFQQLSDQEVKWADMTANEKMNIAHSTAGALAQILGEETAAGKAAAIVQATIDTYKSAQASYASLAGIPVVGPVLGGVAAAAAVAAGIKNVQAITSAGGGGGGGGGGNITAPATTTEQVPAPQMMSGEFDLTGGTAPEPIKAFVVTDEMTNSQNQLANIRRRATI